MKSERAQGVGPIEHEPKDRPRGVQISSNGPGVHARTQGRQLVVQRESEGKMTRKYGSDEKLEIETAFKFWSLREEKRGLIYSQGSRQMKRAQSCIGLCVLIYVIVLK